MRTGVQGHCLAYSKERVSVSKLWIVSEFYPKPDSEVQVSIITRQVSGMFVFPKKCAFSWRGVPGCGRKLDAKDGKSEAGKPIIFHVCAVNHWTMCHICYESLIVPELRAQQQGANDESAPEPKAWKREVRQDPLFNASTMRFFKTPPAEKKPKRELQSAVADTVGKKKRTGNKVS